MNTTVPHSTPHRKHYYTYTLAYPDNFPDPRKAGTVFYVGKGQNGRINMHKYEARKGVKSHKCSVIRLIWACGCEVDKNILAYFDIEQDAFMYEIALIFFMDGLTNLTYGGEGMSGLAPSEITRQKLREAAKGKQNSKGHTHTEEHRRKNSEAKKGHVVSEETRRKLSKANKDRIHTAEARLNMSIAHKGQTPSEENRRKTSETNKGNQYAKGRRSTAN